MYFENIILISSVVKFQLTQQQRLLIIVPIGTSFNGGRGVEFKCVNYFFPPYY